MTPHQKTTDGFEYQIGINHMGHFRLTMLLLPIMKKTKGERRIVVLSSSAHKMGSLKINFDDFHSEKSYSRIGSYAQSKLANILFANELNRKLKKDSIPITVNSVHPGVIPSTDLTRDLPFIIRIPGLWLSPILNLGMKTIEQGAATTVFATVSEELKDNGGNYLLNSHVSKAIDYAYDEINGKKLWDLTEKQTGVVYPIE
jgi:NAD(P)-dependent dehydrogenase (short-subunit alcohol dehydrogenase family)